MRNNPRKDLIIKSAKERFARYGFKKTSMNDIAADLRMGKATLYHYYKTKEEVFNAVIKFELNEFMK
ncbi:MAG: TetR/AcrR family transcriptional regulator, partial [Bacteroidetes bacterium]|nr:TetR/AcrR family transcriptional regulator [Bacteroidota bacterium]